VIFLAYLLSHKRFSDGYVNATAMCKAAGKEWKHYNELVTTKAFILELSSEVGISDVGLVDSIKGGVPQMQGTWVHPQVAIHLAQWLSIISQAFFNWACKSLIMYNRALMILSASVEA